MDKKILGLIGALLALPLMAPEADARTSDEPMAPSLQAGGAAAGAQRGQQTAQFVGPFGGGNLSPQPVYRPGYGYGQDFRPMVLPKYREQDRKKADDKQSESDNGH